MNIRDVDHKETVRCPGCRVQTHPEYLTYVTATGEVVGCSTCIPPRAR